MSIMYVLLGTTVLYKGVSLYIVSVRYNTILNGQQPNFNLNTGHKFSETVYSDMSQDCTVQLFHSVYLVSLYLFVSSI
jgi:hypothetical protein